MNIYLNTNTAQDNNAQTTINGDKKDIPNKLMTSSLKNNNQGRGIKKPKAMNITQIKARSII